MMLVSFPPALSGSKKGKEKKNKEEKSLPSVDCCCHRVDLDVCLLAVSGLIIILLENVPCHHLV